ncbi:hypothetical protein [Aequorivita xiaoshiensis]|uniref:GIY-YIG domain-containing protein n=1 Tax=Aequorivita xiaoshiensis TaxID=2874476 RepID=A0A9X1R5I1_9FLAO|nr:hypothetical protein [Aequorivita xiaoshiensis]MCG2432112.1 hypothetical protein [Aequorivita xiaoshiensis]
MKEHYVYIHLNPKTNEIFYVGKGKGHRKSSKTGRNRKWNEYVQKLNGQFKILVLQNNLTEIEALELEKKIIRKIDWHYDDLTTNVTDSFPDLEDAPTIQIVFGEVNQSTKSNEYIPKFRFQNLSDSEIISTLLDFPNELKIKKLSAEFEQVCEYFHENWDELEEIDEDIFFDIEGVIDTIEDLLTEYKSSEKNNLTDFITDLKREKIEIEIIQEDNPKGKQKEFLINLLKWIENVVEK